jgi:hypothetical protein
LADGVATAELAWARLPTLAVVGFVAFLMLGVALAFLATGFWDFDAMVSLVKAADRPAMRSGEIDVELR